jgi:hypothetical protein
MTTNRFVHDSRIFRNRQTLSKAHQYKVCELFWGIIRGFVGGMDTRNAELRSRPDFAFPRSYPLRTHELGGEKRRESFTGALPRGFDVYEVSTK